MRPTNAAELAAETRLNGIGQLPVTCLVVRLVFGGSYSCSVPDLFSVLLIGYVLHRHDIKDYADHLNKGGVKFKKQGEQKHFLFPLCKF